MLNDKIKNKILNTKITKAKKKKKSIKYGRRKKMKVWNWKREKFKNYLK